MSDTTFNPYASPEADCLTTEKEQRPPQRSGLLLVVTLIHVTVESMCFVIVSALMVGMIFARGWPTQGVEVAIVLGICSLAAFLFFLLRAEFRNFRPLCSRERHIRLATFCLAIFPTAAGICLLCEFHWKNPWRYTEGAGTWFMIALVWILSVGIRWYFHARAVSQATLVRREARDFLGS